MNLFSALEDLKGKIFIKSNYLFFINFFGGNLLIFFGQKKKKKKKIRMMNEWHTQNDFSRLLN
jgi:hypothetical protein